MYEYTMEQLAQDIREGMSKAAESKESALKFLQDAGILDIETHMPSDAIINVEKKK